MQHIYTRALFPVFTLFILISGVIPAASYAAGLGGSWDGQVTQDDPPSSYAMEMQLYGDVGNINYPTLGCGGNLKFIKTDGTTFWYQESLTHGVDQCINGGVIQLRRHALGDDTTWEWRWEGQGVTVRGVVRGSGIAETQ